METVRTYGQTLDLVDGNRGIEWLVAEYRNEAQRMIAKGEIFFVELWKEEQCDIATLAMEA